MTKTFGWEVLITNLGDNNFPFLVLDWAIEKFWSLIVATKLWRP
jgi:hypothetical protein